MDKGKSVFVFVCIGGAIVFSMILADRLLNHGQISAPLQLDKIGEVTDTDMPDMELEEVAEIDVYQPVQVVEEDCIFPNSMLEQFGYGQNNTYGNLHSEVSDLRS